MIHFDPGYADSFLEDNKIDALQPRLEAAHNTLLNKSGAGNDYLGWRDLLLAPNDALLADISTLAEKIRSNADVFVSIGIGGSYLGATATIQALTPYFKPRAAQTVAAGSDSFDDPDASSDPEILFAGHHMSGAYLRELLSYLEGKSVYLNVISKSGTTLEPALAFRFLRDWMEERFDDADDRIIVTTDPERGALNQLQKEKGYKKYVIPPDVGGRFSVLTPVGLLPIAVAGIDIQSLFYGAVDMCNKLTPASDNIALTYAAYRNLFLEQGYKTEILATFEPRLDGISGWWQQLYGESEGKELKGLFPAVARYSTDLHSFGQYVQEGQRTLIETFLMPKDDSGDLVVPSQAANLDGLNYLAGKHYTEINRKAYEGTSKAHADGGVPNMTIWLDNISPSSIGACYYFFEHAVAVSGYMLGINPFNQPGVEAYKKEMFTLLGKPGV